MSLINDALKKAQKQRSGDSPPLQSMPSIGGEPATRIAKRSKPAGFDSMLLWVGVGVAALMIIGIGGFFVIRWAINRPETQPATKTVAVAPVAQPAKPTVETPAHAPTTPAAPIVVPQVATTAEPTVPTIKLETKPVAVAPVVVTPVVAPPPEPEPVKVLPNIKLSSKAVAYIETIKVAGIRASATDSKVLMNDRVYRVGDTVNHDMGLKLAAITLTSLTFEDEFGARYTRNF